MADNVDELLSSAFLLQDQENNSQHGYDVWAEKKEERFGIRQTLFRWDGIKTIHFPYFYQQSNLTSFPFFWSYTP